MPNYDLSIIIPGRNEMFVSQTVADIVKNKRGKTEVIVGLDGSWAEPVIKDHPDVTIYHTSQSYGQRAMTNRCVRLSNAKYVMKVDAHCAFDDGFDIKLTNKMRDDMTMVPVMRNLHAFDWKCLQCGKRWYQGPTPNACEDCDNTTRFERKLVWKGKDNPQSKSYCFDATPHFQYFKEWTKTDAYKEQLKTGLTDTMSLQGSCFLMTRENYWRLNACDETLGSWGSQGIEVACKTWLSGGRVLVNHDTWYAHLFRTAGGDFGFPYHNPHSRVLEVKSTVRDMLFENKWPHQVYPSSWLVEKFWPVRGWTENDLAELKRNDVQFKQR